MGDRAVYLMDQVLAHAGRFFIPEAVGLLREYMPRFLPYAQACAVSDKTVVIPDDLESTTTPEDIWKVPFNGTTLTLWNRVRPPESGNWRAWPGEDAPVWYRHQSGTFLPAWDLLGNLFDLLTFGEERESGERDKHGRFVGAFSPRAGADLLEVPAFNEAVALLVAAAVALRDSGDPPLAIPELIRPPVVVLSHDCDNLEGNDFWTQSVRAYRAVRPLLRGRKLQAAQFRRIKQNAASPRRYYFDNVLKMIEMEKSYGAVSILYLLNGTRGRYGARSSPELVRELAALIPEGWELGMHYNYDTHLNGARFSSQKAELEELTGREMTSGRAHYLRFDPEKSPPFYTGQGIRCDETSGFVDYTGFRNGIAGLFNPWKAQDGEALDLLELPMTVMESTLVNQYGERANEALKRLLAHLKAVGGALTVLFHPDKFDNPEFPHLMGAYEAWLKECRSAGAVFLTPGDLARK